MFGLRINTKHSQAGYTLMEVLIVATIIGILLSVGTVQYLEVKRRAKEKLAVSRLALLATYERMYLRTYGTYGEWDDLREEGYIAQDYNYQNDDLTHYDRPVYVPEYTLEFALDDTNGGFRITAKPVLQQAHLWYPRWVILGGIDDLRSVYVEEDGVVRWLDSDRAVY
ncbi:MAG: type II secretion system protein [bacterium]|nr:type II secretion system protein [bacterium]